MKKYILIGFVLTGCKSSNDYIKEVEKHNLHSIEINGFSMFCPKNYFGYKFNALNTNNEKVSGKVCCNIFFGCTVSF